MKQPGKKNGILLTDSEHWDFIGIFPMDYKKFFPKVQSSAHSRERATRTTCAPSQLTATVLSLKWFAQGQLPQSSYNDETTFQSI